MAKQKPELIDIRSAEDGETRGRKIALRLAAAKQEQKAEAKWASTKKGARPATPNLDAIRAEFETRQSGGTTMAKQKSTRTATVRSARYTEAMAAKTKLDGKLGDLGVRYSAEELTDYIRKVRKADKDAASGDEVQYAYWVEHIAFSRPRWNECWEHATNGTSPEPTTPKPKAPAKKAAAAKAPAKKAPAKKATAANTTAGRKKATANLVRKAAGKAPAKKASPKAAAKTPRRANGTIAPTPKKAAAKKAA